MHLEKVIIWARVGEPVVAVEAKAKAKAKAKAVAGAEIKAVLSAPVDIVFVQNVAKKYYINEE